MRAKELLFSLLLVGVLGTTIAQEMEQLNLQTVVEKAHLRVDQDGNTRTRFSAAETAVSGDELVYTVIFTNISDQRADSVQITNPIPPELRYVAGSAFGPGADISYSVDDGASFAAPDGLMVQLEDGEQRAATPDDYTHVRWTLNNPLEAGARGFARYRVVVR